LPLLISLLLLVLAPLLLVLLGHFEKLHEDKQCL
jgi:hypothetical protein